MNINNGDNGDNGDNKNNFWNNPWISQIGSGLIVAIVMTIFIAFLPFGEILTIIRDIPQTHKNVISKSENIEKKLGTIEKSINDIQKNYLKKDQKGVLITFGINNGLQRNTVSVYKSNTLNLKRDDSIWVTNDNDTYRPTIFMRVEQETNKSDNGSEAEIFINEESAKKLGATDFAKGIFYFYVKLKEDNNDNKQ